MQIVTVKQSDLERIKATLDINEELANQRDESGAASPITRRAFMAAIGGAGISALCSARHGAAALKGQGAVAPANRRRCVDVHHHILPPEYVRLVGRDAIGRPSPLRSVPHWDASKSLSAMDENAVQAAVVSISAPGILLNDGGLAKRLARSCNEFASQMSADHPKRFGFFAALPLPDVEASLTELAHAIERLNCDGVGLMTNYGDRYLGDPLFKPLFDELNRRRAIVYVHPTTCSCDLDVLPGVPSSAIEFPHSTTRTVVSLLFSDTFTQCPNIRFIFSHAGGTIPFLADRISMIARVYGKSAQLTALKRLYYDTALSANAASFSALTKLVTSKQILFGSDFPFAPNGVKATLDGLRGLGLSD